MNRDYTKPHPQSIFKDNPKDYIEVYKGRYCGVRYDNKKRIEKLSHQLFLSKKWKMKTIALFIIKPKQQTP